MNSRNIKNLLRVYFVENGRKDLLWFYGLSVLVITLLFFVDSGFSASHFYTFVYLLVIPKKLFSSLHHTSSSIHYMMIPATPREKVATNFLLLNIYSVLVMALAYVTSVLLIFIMSKLFSFSLTEGIMVQAFQGMGREYISCLFLGMSIFFFGSIYFKKRSLVKTLGLVLIFFTFIVALMVFVVWVNAKLTLPQGLKNMHYSIVDHKGVGFPDSLVVINSLLTLYFYALSFIRLRETEV